MCSFNYPVSRPISLGTIMIGVAGSQSPVGKPPSATNEVLPVVPNTSANKAQFANVSKQSTYQISLVERGETIAGSNPYNFTFSIISASPQTMSQIKFVTYYLHPTFNPSVVTKTSAENNFALSFTGWRKFDLRAKVFFKDGQSKDLVFPATQWTLEPMKPGPIPIVQYEFVRKWGSAGSANGQFHFPQGIAVDSSNNVYVADSGNNRIQEFNSNGTFITSWGSNGKGDAQFHTPKGIAVDSSNNVYVADSGNNRIQEFDTTANMTFITKWYGAGQFQEFIKPEGIAIDLSDNTVYVADTGNNIIQVFKLSSVCPPFSKIATGVCFAAQNLGSSNLSSPRGIAVDSSHNVYVADSAHNRILKFDSVHYGNLISNWGLPGTGNGQFITPLDVAVDQSGNNVYVADSRNNRIQEFNSNGTFITSWGSAGSANGQFHFPQGIAVDSSNNVYVADSQNNRIEVFATKIPTNIASR